MIAIAFSAALFFLYQFWLFLSEKNRVAENRVSLGLSLGKIILIGLPSAIYTFVIVFQTPPSDNSELLFLAIYTNNSIVHPFVLILIVMFCLKFIGNINNNEIFKMGAMIILQFAAGSFMIGLVISFSLLLGDIVLATSQ